jgi:muramoyltetrapeptide carboxypeptidase LdcA involved in peptidoglycan recycling
MGYHIIKGENLYLNKVKGRSNTPKKCAGEFNKAYLEDDSQVIISVGGGELMCEILPYIDFKKIKKANSKIFMGFSDNTNLTFTLTTIAHVYSIYGPCMGAFAFTPFDYSRKDAFALLTNKTHIIEGYPKWERFKEFSSKEEPLRKSEYLEDKIIKTYPKSEEIKMTGRLLGGCLDCLLTLCGTKFDHTVEYIENFKDDGIIWYLEACDLNPLDIQRGLFQLKQASWFQYVKGFILGRPLCFKEKMFGINHYQAFKNELKDLKVPLIMDADLGHFDPSMPLINGMKANVTYKNNNITIEYLEME